MVGMVLECTRRARAYRRKDERVLRYLVDRSGKARDAVLMS